MVWRGNDRPGQPRMERDQPGQRSRICLSYGWHTGMFSEVWVQSHWLPLGSNAYPSVVVVANLIRPLQLESEVQNPILHV